MLADASPGDGAAMQAGGLAVVVVEAPLLAAAGPRRVAAAGVQHTTGLAQARGRGAGHCHPGGRRAGRETQPGGEREGEKGREENLAAEERLIMFLLLLIVKKKKHFAKG